MRDEGIYRKIHTAHAEFTLVDFFMLFFCGAGEKKEVGVGCVGPVSVVPTHPTGGICATQSMFAKVVLSMQRFEQQTLLPLLTY